MLYDDLVQPGKYLCHHGIKGQRWGVRHFQDTHWSSKTRQAYKNRLVSERKKSKDRDASYRQEKKNIVKNHIKSYLKTFGGTLAASALVSIGATTAATLIGGPAGLVTMQAISAAGTIPISIGSTAQAISRWVNTISSARTLTDVYKK